MAANVQDQVNSDIELFNRYIRDGEEVERLREANTSNMFIARPALTGTMRAVWGHEQVN